VTAPRRLLVSLAAVLAVAIAVGLALSLSRPSTGGGAGPREPAGPVGSDLARRADAIVAGYAAAPGAPPTVPAVPGAGSRPDGYTISSDGRFLRLSFAGAPDQPGPCGADYEARAFEYDPAVVVAVIELPREGREDAICPAIAALRAVEVELTAALGRRPVLSLVDGLPVLLGDPYRPR
jgi:hypothetical protein